jgi:hypothetical protein
MPHGTSWEFGEDRLLGTMSDEDVARRLGRTVRATLLRRQQLQIQKFQSRRRPWTEAEERLLGTMSDRRFARRFQRSVGSVKTRRYEKDIALLCRQKHRWQPADYKLLGVRPDEEVALLLGLTKVAVSRRRQLLGIPVRR